MKKAKQKTDSPETIEVWRPPDFAQLELRRGVAVAGAVPRHWHEEYQFCLIQAGEGELTYRGSNHPTPPASLFIVHPGEVHSNRSYDRHGCSYRAVYLETALLGNAAAELSGKNTTTPFFPGAVVSEPELLSHYLRLYRTLEQPAARLEREARLLEFLSELITRFAEQRLVLRKVGLEPQAVKRACEYLRAHFVENVSLEKLANLAGLSPFHFHRVFAEHTGLPPHAYQNQLRVFRAKELLRQGDAVSLAAVQAGFFDQSHLTRHFKRLVGIPPGRYQEGSKNVQDGVDASH